MKPKLIILCGHYGCGKTNLSLNLAIKYARQGEKVTLLDMDVVNPYFRSSEYGALLSKENIRLITPVYANTGVEAPVLSPQMYSIFAQADESRTVIIDTGGDDAGITAMGGISRQMRENGYEMLYVINQNRALSQTPALAVSLLREIEGAGHLKATAIVNNSHLGVETTLQTVLESIPFAQETANLAGIPLLYSTIADFAAAGTKDLPPGLKVIRRYVKFPWEAEQDQ